ncbi:galactonate dehydratase [Microlunatus sp. GCM10028923]|uniref:galactonate dehydratase n=1 Tax=Microlunatus sp. GCM10028923 TaxID=3273400 RepID=UPI003612B75E
MRRRTANSIEPQRTRPMKITSVETFVITNRRILLKISTDTGHYGWGEPTLEGWARPIEAIVEQMANYLVGQDPRRITHHWQVLARGGFYRGGPLFGSALAGIDQALWDLKGRALGVPIHELLGGAVRSKIRIYAHAGGRSGHTGSPERARMLVEAGYTMIKVAPDGQVGFVDNADYLDRFVADVTELREAIGGSVDFGIDLHGRFSVPMSRRALPLIEHLAPAFVEEPLRPEHSELIGSVVDSTSIPIATGERLYTRTEFRAVLEAGVAVVQPDLSHAGGISESFRIATQAEIYDAQLAPHCPLGPVALAACLQVDAAVPNFLAQETVIELHDQQPGRGLELLTNPEVLAPVDGYLPVLTGPGLGIELDEDVIRSQVATEPLAPGSPTWFYPADDSFAEW